MSRAKKSTEISVRLGDRIGTGASLFGKLKDAGVNVIASCCYQIQGQAHFTIVPDDSERAQQVLRDKGLEFEAQPVLLIEMPHEVGAFASVLEEISKLKVSVRSAYCTTTKNRSAVAVIKTDDDEKVLAEVNK